MIKIKKMERKRIMYYTIPNEMPNKATLNQCGAGLKTIYCTVVQSATNTICLQATKCWYARRVHLLTKWLWGAAIVQVGSEEVVGLCLSRNVAVGLGGVVEGVGGWGDAFLNDRQLPAWWCGWTGVVCRGQEKMYLVLKSLCYLKGGVISSNLKNLSLFWCVSCLVICTQILK